jgi:hypothetical protein
MRAVPRYFFNIIDGKFLVDHEGSECSGLEEARAQAISTAGALLRDLGGTLPYKSDWQMHVTDASSMVVYKLRFSEEKPV